MLIANSTYQHAITQSLLCREVGRTEICLDGNQLCPAWASLGRCTGETKDYMLNNCKKSCKVCGVDAKENGMCMDKSQYCSAWAGAGKWSVGQGDLVQAKTTPLRLQL